MYRMSNAYFGFFSREENIRKIGGHEWTVIKQSLLMKEDIVGGGIYSRGNGSADTQHNSLIEYTSLNIYML